jgi:hypothetical protein
MDLRGDQIKKISQIFGREISAAEQGNVIGLEAFTEADIAEMRKFGPNNSILAICYIRFRLKPNTRLGTVGFYYSSVFNEGMPVKKCLEILEIRATPHHSAQST